VNHTLLYASESLGAYTTLFAMGRAWEDRRAIATVGAHAGHALLAHSTPLLLAAVLLLAEPAPAAIAQLHGGGGR
jgi:hypothetical protein